MINENDRNRRKYILYLNKIYSNSILDLAETLKSEPYEVIRGIVEIYCDKGYEDTINELKEKIYEARSRTLRNKQQYEQRNQ